MKKVSRNEPCPCGSGKKYKNCHMETEMHKSSRKQVLTYIMLFALIIIIAIIGVYLNNKESGSPPGPAPAGKVWSEEHGHYH